MTRPSTCPTLTSDVGSPPNPFSSRAPYMPSKILFALWNPITVLFLSTTRSPICPDLTSRAGHSRYPLPPSLFSPWSCTSPIFCRPTHCLPCGTLSPWFSYPCPGRPPAQPLHRKRAITLIPLTLTVPSYLPSHTLSALWKTVTLSLSTARPPTCPTFTSRAGHVGSSVGYGTLISRSSSPGYCKWCENITNIEEVQKGKEKSWQFP